MMYIPIDFLSSQLHLLVVERIQSLCNSLQSWTTTDRPFEMFSHYSFSSTLCDLGVMIHVDIAHSYCIA